MLCLETNQSCVPLSAIYFYIFDQIKKSVQPGRLWRWAQKPKEYIANNNYWRNSRSSYNRKRYGSADLKLLNSLVFPHKSEGQMHLKVNKLQFVRKIVIFLQIRGLPFYTNRKKRYLLADNKHLEISFIRFCFFSRCCQMWLGGSTTKPRLK